MSHVYGKGKNINFFPFRFLYAEKIPIFRKREELIDTSMAFVIRSTFE
jgi:hypothetical protein